MDIIDLKARISARASATEAGTKTTALSPAAAAPRCEDAVDGRGSRARLAGAYQVAVHQMTHRELHGALEFVRRVVEAQDGEDVLQVLVFLEDALDHARRVVVVFSDDALTQNRADRTKRVDRRVDATFGDGAFQRERRGRDQELPQDLPPGGAERLPALLSPDGLVVVESDWREEPELPLAVRTSRRYGSARVTLFEQPA